MKINRTLLTASALLGSLAMGTAGNLTGKVTLKGTPPPPITIRLDETCGKLNTGSPATRHYLVGKDNGLANVFVYVKGAPAGKIPDTEPVIDQKGCMYEPYITGLMVGQKVKIKNSDPTLHNVHAMEDKGAGSKDFFNHPQPQGFPDIEESFSKPEVLVKVKCDVHPWMFAYIGVVDNPYFAVTDADGNFTIKGVPDGTYQVVAFHEKTHRGGDGISKEVTIKGDTKVDFTVELK